MTAKQDHIYHWRNVATERAAQNDAPAPSAWISQVEAFRESVTRSGDL